MTVRPDKVQVRYSAPEIVGPPETILEKWVSLNRKLPWLPFVCALLVSSVIGFFYWRSENLNLPDDQSHGDSGLLFSVGQVLPFTPQNVAILVPDTFIPLDDEIRTGIIVDRKDYIRVNSMNKEADMVGVHASGSSLHAFLRQKDDVTDLGTLPGDSESSALSINSYGTIVGYSGSSSHRATMWFGGKVYDLNERVPPQNGLRLTDAVEIDDTDSIVALAKNPDHSIVLVRLLPRE